MKRTDLHHLALEYGFEPAPNETDDALRARIEKAMRFSDTSGSLAGALEEIKQRHEIDVWPETNNGRLWLYHCSQVGSEEILRTAEQQTPVSVAVEVWDVRELRRQLEDTQSEVRRLKGQNEALAKALVAVLLLVAVFVALVPTGGP